MASTILESTPDPTPTISRQKPPIKQNSTKRHRSNGSLWDEVPDISLVADDILDRPLLPNWQDNIIPLPAFDGLESDDLRRTVLFDFQKEGTQAQYQNAWRGFFNLCRSSNIIQSLGGSTFDIGFLLKNHVSLMTFFCSHPKAVTSHVKNIQYAVAGILRFVVPNIAVPKRIARVVSKSTSKKTDPSESQNKPPKAWMDISRLYEIIPAAGPGFAFAQLSAHREALILLFRLEGFFRTEGLEKLYRERINFCPKNTGMSVQLCGEKQNGYTWGRCRFFPVNLAFPQICIVECTRRWIEATPDVPQVKLVQGFAKEELYGTPLICNITSPFSPYTKCATVVKQYLQRLQLPNSDPHLLRGAAMSACLDLGGDKTSMLAFADLTPKTFDEWYFRPAPDPDWASQFLIVADDFMDPVSVLRSCIRRPLSDIAQMVTATDESPLNTI